MNDYDELLDTISHASHDIKNILSSIASSYQFIDEHYPETAGFNLWDTLGNAINSMTKYLEQTTTLRYSHSIKEPVKFNINNLLWELPDCMDDIYECLPSNEIRNYNFNLVNCDCFIMGDYEKLKIAFTEILKNSYDATSDGDSINIDSTIQDNSIIISFTDYGNGISADVIDDIIKPLYSTKSNHAGTGLSIANNIIQLHSGSLELSSLPPETCISIHIPIVS